MKCEMFSIVSKFHPKINVLTILYNYIMYMPCATIHSFCYHITFCYSIQSLLSIHSVAEFSSIFGLATCRNKGYYDINLDTANKFLSANAAKHIVCSPVYS